MDTLNATLARTRLQGQPAPVPVSVSHGVSRFTALIELERAIEQADEAMYKQKQAYKARAVEGSV